MNKLVNDTVLDRLVKEDADEAVVASALELARSAFTAWKTVPISERSQLLRAVRSQLLNHMDEMVETIAEETGKVITEAIVSEVVVACEVLSYYASHAQDILHTRSVFPGLLIHKRACIRYEPLGVIGVISPWNYPLVLAIGPVATALAAGNSVILKPSEYTPKTGVLIAKLIARAGGPEGLVQVLTGHGPTGEALVRSGVDKIAFTGSVRSGKAVMRAAADHLTPVLLELGGKDPFIVCKDADLDRAARACVWGSFTNCGQTCMATERVYAVKEVYDIFLDKVLALTARLRQGNEPGDDVGAVIHEGQLGIIDSHLADALDKGARVAYGGKHVDVAGRPSIQPTVLLDVDHSMAVMTEETFGPLLPIMKVEDEDEALRLANDSRYGLNASIFAKDPRTIEKLVAGIRSGNVCVNDVMISYGIPALPFGGIGDSGFGRSHGPEGLKEMSHLKSVAEDRFGLGREPSWMPVPSWLSRAVKTGLRLLYRPGRAGLYNSTGQPLYVNGSRVES
ncbi:MAG: aldehyde dehydrogenase family protein [Actinobacteria bacterium]|nr:aldehyde dehydrogenase family protein [Actinomycetota bacterium]MCL5446491.1 aldehyde dehydrogenase family protein [Actinomycetota bacterium]